jgi:hypothetical protein
MTNQRSILRCGGVDMVICRYVALLRLQRDNYTSGLYNAINTFSGVIGAL